MPNQRKKSLISIVLRLEPEMLACLDADVAAVKASGRSDWTRTARIRELIEMFCPDVPKKRAKP